MQQLFAQLFSQFSEFFSGLSPLKRMSIMLSSFIIMGTLVIVSFMMTSTNYAVLFSDVPPNQLPLVVQNLQQKNIPFRLADNGARVLVPRELLHATQMAVMTELGTGEIGSVGLEIFDKQDFGATSYSQRINYQRALQGELMRAINTISSVRQSRVILALPERKTFLEESAQPSASVVIDLHTGKTLQPEQIRGITQLVASSVQDLVPERVTVVDTRGRTLSRDGSPESVASAELLDIKARVEANIEQRVESILARVVGVGKVTARVNATLNPRHISMIEETVDPDSTAIRSVQTEEEVLDGARTNPVGIPGARANLPGAEEMGEVGFKQNVRKELKSTNFAVPKTVRNVREAAGGVERISVAVLVDGVEVPVTLDDGTVELQWQPRSAEELARFETIVRNAIGFNAARGDSVSIESIRFQYDDMSDAQGLMDFLDLQKLLRNLMQWSLLGIGLVLFFFIVMRPFMRWITDSFQDSVEDILPRTIEELEELQSVDNTLPGMSGALPVLEESLDPDKAESELLKERIMSMMEQDEEKSAGAFSLWLTRRDM